LVKENEAMKHLVLVLGLIVLGGSAPAVAQKQKDEGSYIKIEVKGKLKTGIVAIGGETTGTVVYTKAGLLELDLSGNKKLPDEAKKLDGKVIIARGELTFKAGVSRPGIRNIVKVTAIKAADGK
jgi:hypothetical protein